MTSLLSVRLPTGSRLLPSNRSSRTASLLAAASVAVVMGAVNADAFGQVNASWVSAVTGNWTDPTRWTSNPNYPNNGTPPGTSYAAFIDVIGSPYNVSLASNVSVSTLSIESDTATLKLNPGANLTAVNRLTVAGIIDQSGGILNVTSGTALADLHGSASYNQSGGTFNFGPNLVIGALAGDTPNYSLFGAGATLNGVQLNVGANDGAGTFTHSAGTANITGYVALGDGSSSASGVYTLSGGTITTPNHYVGASGTGFFSQSGGWNIIPNGLTNSISIGEDPGAAGTYVLSGGTILTSATVVGHFGTGSFEQSGGTHSIDGVLRVGRDVGSKGHYTLGGTGVLTTGGEADVGFAGFGTFVQTGGLYTANGPLFVAKGGASRGRYSLSFGTLVANNSVVISAGGLGTFEQSGGRVTVNSSLNIQTAGAGTYLLSGGTLSAFSMNNNGTFAQSGGVGSVGVVAGTGSIGISGAGSFSAGAIRQGFMSISGGAARAAVRANGTSVAASRIGTLSISSGGLLDLFDNDLIVINSPFSTIENYVATARNGGDWLGASGITSTTARTNPAGSTSLGVIRGADYLAANGAGTAFNGFNVSSSDTLVKYTWYGDTDFNGIVDFDDYVRVDAGYNASLSGWFNGDFDYSGVVDFDDYVLADLGFNSQNGTLRRAQDFLDGTDRSRGDMVAPGLAKVVQHFDQFGTDYARGFLAAVPEPSAAGLIAGLVALLPRRRRSH